MNLGVEDIARITNEPDLDQGIVQAKDKNVLFFAASEFNKIIGQNNFSMIDFLTTMYDGDDYEYQIKAGKTTLKDPLIGLVAGTTPQSLSIALPPSAGGQGFLSRIILVYGARKHKLVPRPSVRSEEHTSELQSLMRISYAVFCLKKKTKNKRNTESNTLNKNQQIKTCNIHNIVNTKASTKQTEQTNHKHTT